MQYLISESQITIQRLGLLLEEHQIGFMIKDENEAGRLAGFGTVPNTVDLYVAEEDFIRAEALVRGYLSGN